VRWSTDIRHGYCNGSINYTRITLFFNIKIISSRKEKYSYYGMFAGRSQWPRRLSCRSAAECLLGSWVQIPPGALDVCVLWVFVLSSRGLWDRPIPRPEESYWLRCVSECDQVKIKQPRHLLWVGRRGKDYETKRIYLQAWKDFASPYHSQYWWSTSSN
jgi:hypothetical protein